MTTEANAEVFPDPKEEPAQEPRNLGGRPVFVPTEADRNLVKNLAAAGVAEAQIAEAIPPDGIDPKTLRKYFARELLTSKNHVTAMATSKVVAAINAGEAWGICFWLKTRAGWKETHALEHAGEVTIKRVLGVSDEEI